MDSQNANFRPPSAFIKASIARQNKLKLSTASLATPPPPTTNKSTTLTDLDTALTNPLPHLTSLSPAGTTPTKPKPSSDVLTTPSKTAQQIAKLKAARESRRAAAAEMKTQQDALGAEEKETRVYRAEIEAFRVQWNAMRGDFLMNDLGGCNENEEEDGGESRIQLAKNLYDTVTTTTSEYPRSQIFIHEPKTRVDTSKYTETHEFMLDHSFDETSTNEEVYLATGKPLVKSLFEGGMCTFFAYGQTGSGKTHTIFGTTQTPGIYTHLCRDIISHLPASHHLSCSFFELYGPKINDLLSPHQHTPISLCEDKNGNVQLLHLYHERVTTLDQLLDLVDRGRKRRTTRATNANSESSRSHALVQIRVMDANSHERGVLSLVDLAGSERGSSESIPRSLQGKKIQTEASEINKSLLILKECIRSLYKRGSGAADATHVPFRGSKLTHILRDSFLCKESRTVMVATVAPGSTSVEHTLNTLRYADRVKELGRDDKPIGKSSGKGGKWESSPLRDMSRTVGAVEGKGRAGYGVRDEDDSEQQTIDALQEDRNLVSRLGKYGESDSEDEEDEQQRETRLPRSVLETYDDMNALRNLIHQSKLRGAAVAAMQEVAASEKRLVISKLEREIGGLQVDPSLSQEEQEESVPTISSSESEGGSDFFYQDALSVESTGYATAGESSDEEHHDADEAEWKRYCSVATAPKTVPVTNTSDSNSTLSLRNRHIVQVQEQLMEIDSLLLERVRSGRMGIGSYIGQLSELLQQRVDALRRAGGET
ncbi:hypothetical protein HDU98_010860 [Podochytrium sp. JEL0797]|nr:hypothetical protein HDU98_010860 [Podochytrium sp. JEL0797]